MIFPSRIAAPLRIFGLDQINALQECGSECQIQYTFPPSYSEWGALKIHPDTAKPSSPAVTLNVYSYWMKDTNQEAAKGLEMAVIGISGDLDGDQNETRGCAMKRNPSI